MTTDTEMYGDHVRVQFLGPGAWTQRGDIMVDRKVGNEWVNVACLNSMTNDYAFTEARGIARRTEAQMAALARGA